MIYILSIFVVITFAINLVLDTRDRYVNRDKTGLWLASISISFLFGLSIAFSRVVYPLIPTELGGGKGIPIEVIQWSSNTSVLGRYLE